ncbi:MAG: FlaD/FlaE family flagellar protein [Candidatus Thermoplasmatota archaeon]|nr:FlaD/FlaE family flagellar protein [Candidatus Thermoplasmatota archaeon]
MGENSKDEKNKISEKFELKSELSALVAKNVIPKKIADKLEQKLKERQVKIGKADLDLLVSKIRDVMHTYARFGQSNDKNKVPDVEQPMGKKTELNVDMKKLVDSTKELQERIANVENTIGKSNESNHSDISTEEEEIQFGMNGEKISSPKIVTTEDIKVPYAQGDIDPLTEIPNDPESVVVLMKWLQFLIDKCRRSYLSDILDYYVDVGWISEDAKISLIDYSSGITEERKKEGTVSKGASDLPVRDHIQSLLFIQKLKGKQFDKHFLDRIDGDISRMMKKLDNHHLK